MGSKVEEAPTAPVVAAKPKKAKKKIVIEEVDSSVDDLEKEVSDAMNAVNGILDCEAPTETPKKVKKKIVIEEVDSSKVEEAPAAAKPKKKKIVIEEVDSSKVEEAPAAPVTAAKSKKKKIVIEEVDSSKVEEDSCD